MTYIVAIDQHNGEYQTVMADSFPEAYGIIVEVLVRWQDVTIDLFENEIAPDKLMTFAWRAGENIHVTGRGPDRQPFEATISLLDLQPRTAADAE